MNLCRLVLFPLLLPVCVVAAQPAPPAATPKQKAGGGFVFSLLPRSLQRNPRMDFNIITETTAAGRRIAPPTRAKPQYYIAQAGRMLNTGVGPEALNGPPKEQLERMMTRALADGGYLAAQPAGDPPKLVIVYNWGSSSFQPPASVADENGEGDIPEPEVVIRKTLLDRAMLIGGRKFFREVAEAMEQVDRKAGMQRAFVTPEGGDFMGSVGDMIRDPFDELRARDAETERLVDELFSSSYFVVASAYDHDAMVKGQRVLLWRTKMTVNSLGLSINESVPSLIASAGPYLGRDTPEPIVVTKRLDRAGRVEIGPTTIVEEPAAPAAPATEKQ